MPRLAFAVVVLSTSVWAQVTTSFRNGALPTAGYGGMLDVAVVGDNGEPWNPAVNYEGGDDWLDGSPNTEGILMRFDLTAIPLTATVSSATLSLTFNDGTGNSYALYALNRLWVPTEATWLRATTGQMWQTAGAQGGADRSPSSGGTVTGTGTIGVVLNAVGRAMVQGWIAAPINNFGLTIQDYGNGDGTDIRNCDFATAAARPQLTVVTNMGTFVFRNGVSPVATYSGCVDVAIGQGSNPVTTNWNDSSAFEVDGLKTIWVSVNVSSIPPWSSVVAASFDISVTVSSSAAYDFYEALRPWDETTATWLNSNAVTA